MNLSEDGVLSGTPTEAGTKTFTVTVNDDGVCEPSDSHEYTIIVSPAKSTVATVTSESYTVSTGGTGDETITNVAYGTTKADFIAAITKGESHESFDEALLHDTVVTGDKLVVTAEDGTTKVTYTVTVNPAKSTVATVTSESYIVSAAGTADEGITNVPYGTTKADFIAALTKGESHESFDETSLHDPVVSGDKLVVTAEDGTTKVTYTVIVNAATAPTVFTVNQPTSADNGVNDDGKSSVTVTWTDSTTAAVDHYEIVAKVGAAPGVSDTVAGETSITKGIQTAAFDWTAGENLYVGVVAVDANGLKTLCSGTTANVTVEADGHTASKSTVATVTSTSYTVSTAGTGDETITNVPYGTTKADFIAAITKGESHESFDEALLHDPVVTGDKIVVTAEDGTTKVTYTVSVNAAPPAPKNTVATVTSGSYIVSAGGTADETITNVPYGTTKSDFIAALTKGESHESFDEASLHDPVVSGDKIVVTAEDGTTKVTYTITVNSAPTAANASNNTVNLSTSNITAGGNITITAVGDRQEASGSIVGDERYIPNTWTSTESGKGGSFSFNGTSYNANYVTGTAGSYTITVNYKKQSWNGSSWVDVLGISDSKTENVTVNAVVPPNPEPTPVETTGSVVDDSGKSVQGIKAQVTTETDGTKTVAVKSHDAIVLRTPDGTVSPLTDISGLSFSTTGNTNVTLSSDGTIKVKDLANGTQSKINVTLDVGNGQKIVIGTIDVKVSESGAVSITSTLIDPYGIITDSVTGKIIDGANLTLYYANTDRNKANGKTPDTVVSLPIIDDFKPNKNENPQVSDASGAYGFMVFPNTDYYITVDKEGYDKYTSSTISVEQEIVKFDVKMNKSVPAPQNSSINPGTADFDKNIGKQADVNTTLTLNGNTLVSIANGDKILVNGTDYTITDDAVIIKKEYLAAQNTGTAALTFNFSGGNPQTLSITIKDTTPSSSGGSGGSGGLPSTPANIQLERISGQNRVDTAIAIAKAAYKDKVSNVILASSGDYPDALAGSVLAHKLKAPILLVGNSMEDREKVSAYLKENMNQAGNIYILGGNCAVDPDVEEKLEADGFKNIQRLGGKDRYETNAKINDMLAVKEGTPVIIVSGESYPDAISVSSAAAANQYPVLLVKKDEISDYVRKKISDIKPDKIYIIGLQGAVSDTVENQVVQTAGIDKSKVVRIGGTDRFQTSLNVAKYFSSDADIVCAASGNNFPDALAGSTYAANSNAPILLINTSLSNEENLFLQSLKLKEVTIFGGTGAVSKDVENDLSKITGK
ncbi:N-acetylmuramoyl-L-alanine amidase LytC precursor [Clostridium ragsdalei P11]|uniref:N-acetylmuramoyl-L-alanine amidase LytC n=1 Tax=Clostridium ragsdalei P11 TaxID=1353534 RepID=A0A1A6APS9_9CLOT|nr:N-acetylmuramoyl-L-alanine amidase LytC precursor [Clostridium ragsdalei P11]